MSIPSASGEAESARDKLTKLLAKHSLSWNDLPAILAATELSNLPRSRAYTAKRKNLELGRMLGIIGMIIEIKLPGTAIGGTFCGAGQRRQ
jgi:hypothetical protein